MVNIKKQLSHVETVSLETITRTWIEIVLERNNFNRTRSCIELGISSSKMRTYITEKKIKAEPSPAGKRAKG